jgi:toxin HigB-1
MQPDSAHQYCRRITRMLIRAAVKVAFRVFRVLRGSSCTVRASSGSWPAPIFLERARGAGRYSPFSAKRVTFARKPHVFLDDHSVNDRDAAPPPGSLYVECSCCSRIITLDVKHVTRVYQLVIVSYRCADTRALAGGQRVRRFAGIESVARRKLRQLEIAGRLEDLRVPPGNRLEALKGDRAGRHSIRINDRFRVCFRWTGAGAVDVEIVDYH